MTEKKTSKMNLDHERKIAELQERVNMRPCGQTVFKTASL